ncbi:MAG TPA: hypothetical protein GX706_01190 [Candidatus Moranbacteria bacterium]|nr:hypothetical protein [Candidatus Moranbacteria bacterium]
MKPFKIYPFNKKLTLHFSGKRVKPSSVLKKEINNFWNDLISSGKKYSRGEVFTVVKKEVTDKEIKILLDQTDYAHYLYSTQVDLGNNSVRVIHSAVMVETADNYIVMGKMGQQTARAGTYQFSGGGLGKGDLKDGFFDLDYATRRELLEEFNLDVLDEKRVKDFAPIYFKEGGPTDKMTVIYQVKLRGSKKNFFSQYEKFVSDLKYKGQAPEFESLVAFKNNLQGIEEFFSQHRNQKFDEYMLPLFEYIKSQL